LWVQIFEVLFLRPVFPLLLQSIFALLCACGLSVLTGDQTLGALRNITTNEKMNGARYEWITTNGRFHNRFDRCGYHRLYDGQ
jgi:hypothetical protein